MKTGPQDFAEPQFGPNAPVIFLIDHTHLAVLGQAPRIINVSEIYI
jgi:hypothetical protein